MRNAHSRYMNVTVVLVVAILTSACSPNVSLAPESSGSSPSPVGSSSPAPVEVERIVVTAETVLLVNSDGTVAFETTYFEPTDGLVAALTEASGATPERNEESFHERGEFERIAWNGFEILDDRGDGKTPYQPGFSVRATADSLAEIALEAIDGIAVGDSAPELESAYPDSSNRGGPTGEPESLSVYVGKVDLPSSTDDGGVGTDPNFTVWVIATDPAGSVTEFRAPSPNFGV